MLLWFGSGNSHNVTVAIFDRSERSQRPPSLKRGATGPSFPFMIRTVSMYLWPYLTRHARKGQFGLERSEKAIQGRYHISWF